jgi:hypothetical protein
LVTLLFSTCARLELKPDFRGVMRIHGVAFPIEASKPEWNERHNAVCMDIMFKALSLRGRRVKSHFLRTPFKGYEPSMAINFGYCQLIAVLQKIEVVVHKI